MLQQMVIQQATVDDLSAVLSLFDTAVSWLAERGYGGQWGVEPFSQRPDLVERFAAWIAQGILYVACEEGRVLGTIVLNPVPPAYLRSVPAVRWRECLYLEAFVTDRRRRGRGVGRYLLEWAAARAQQEGYAWLQLDCWAGNQQLCRYYEQAGFVRCGSFMVGTWPGALFEQAVRAPGQVAEARKP